MNTNLALPPPMLCESVVHNALQQQDRGNYHNQRRRSSISGEPWGVNEAERRRRRERWVSAWEAETEGGGEGGEWAHVCWFPPKNSKASCQKIATHVINHSEKIYLSIHALSFPLFHLPVPLFPHNLPHFCFSIFFGRDSLFIFDLCWLCRHFFFTLIPAPTLLKCGSWGVNTQQGWFWLSVLRHTRENSSSLW